MLSDLATVYGVDFKRDRAKALVGALLGGVAPGMLSHGVMTSVGALAKSIPVIGTAIGMITMPLFSYAVTRGIGMVFIQHFESGGTFLDFNIAEKTEALKTEIKKAATDKASEQSPA